jgi:4-carboxymuconolactone decarboxylase
MPRVTPVASKGDVSPEYQAVVDDVLKVFGAIRGPFSMMLHSPEMAKRMLPLVSFFRDESVVEGKLRSVGILAAVREREASYVWAAQVTAARRNGLREEAIDLLRAKANASKFPAEEAAIVTYVRQLMRTNRADQAAFARRCRFRPTRAAFSRCSSTTTAPGSRSTRPGLNCSPPARKAAALSGNPERGAASAPRTSRSASRPTRAK